MSIDSMADIAVDAATDWMLLADLSSRFLTQTGAPQRSDTNQTWRRHHSILSVCLFLFLTALFADRCPRASAALSSVINLVEAIASADPLGKYGQRILELILLGSVCHPIDSAIIDPLPHLVLLN